VYSRLQLAAKYAQFYLGASSGFGHGVHSPFVYDFIRNVLHDNRNFYAYQDIEGLRKQLLRDRTTVKVEDYGAGSAYKATGHKRISDLAKNAAKSPKLGQLLFRMAQYYKPATILELGTSLGISTAYLAAGNLHASVISVEGSEAIASRARNNLSSLELNNVELITGHFDQVLPTLTNRFSGIDMVFIDGNHQKEAIWRYFNFLIYQMSSSSVLIFDDIHWSREMEEAWSMIKHDARVLTSVEGFFFGIVFFNKNFVEKQNFSIRF
jgi:predicted O-methyltransferase YrrM